MLRAALLLVVAFAASTESERFGDDIAGTVVWHSYGAMVALLVWIGAARQPRGARSGWFALAASLTLWVVGDVVWDVLAWSRPLPDVSPADLFYLSGYLGCLVSLVVLTRQATGTLPTDAVLDGLVAALGVGLVLWVLLIEPAADAGTPFRQAVLLAYPLAAMALLAALAWMRFHPERSQLPPGLGLFGAAVGMLVVLEPLYSYWDLYGASFDTEPVLDRLYHVSFGLMVLSTFRTRPSRHRPDPRADHPLRFLVLGAALFCGPVVVAATDTTKVWVALFMAVIAGLVLARFVLLNLAWQRAKVDLAHQADHDGLTGLANRRLLADSVAVANRQSTAGDAHVALLYIDLDHFKAINDEHGHAAGDAVLVAIAERLRLAVRPGDLPARLGGDEFVVLCERTPSLRDAKAVAKRLGELAVAPIELENGATVSITLSIGIAMAGGVSTSLDALLRDADAALYEAKAGGRDRMAVFEGGVPAP